MAHQRIRIHTHYDNLRVVRNAPTSVIKAAYRALCQTYHPDRHPAGAADYERITKIINKSYAVLIDPEERARHDSWIAKQKEQARQQEARPPSRKAGRSPGYIVNLFT